MVVSGDQNQCDAAVSWGIRLTVSTKQTGQLQPIRRDCCKKFIFIFSALRHSKKHPLLYFKLNLLRSMTSSHSPAPRFSRSLPITCAGILFSFFQFFFSLAALLHESGRQILWQLQCFHLTPDGAASVYFTDQLLAKTTSSCSTQSAASPLGSLAHSDL